MNNTKLIAVDISTKFGSKYGKTSGLGDLVSLFVSASIVVAGIIFLFLLVGGGLKMVMSAGQNDPRSAGQGKQAVTSALAGFIIVITAYWIIRIIEVITGTTFLTSPF